RGAGPGRLHRRLRGVERYVVRRAPGGRQGRPGDGGPGAGRYGRTAGRTRPDRHRRRGRPGPPRGRGAAGITAVTSPVESCSPPAGTPEARRERLAGLLGAARAGRRDALDEIV